MMDVKKISLICMVAIYTVAFGTQAQVTIGSGTIPVTGALLEIKDREAISPVSVTDTANITSKTGGLGLPRVQLSDRTTLEPFISVNSDWVNDAGSIKEKYAGLTVYNIKVSDSSETATNKQFHPGICIWDGSRWQQQGDISQLGNERFFYLQPFCLPLNTGQASQTFNLYEEYMRQFSKDGIGSVFISSNPALEQILSDGNKRLYNADELDFALTFYDDEIITVTGIDTSGMMTYTAKKSLPEDNPKILMNVVLVIR